VLNDNQTRAPQWRRLLGEYLAPRLGGTAAAWADANVGAFERSWARLLAQLALAGASGGVDAWTREDRRAWLLDMCEQVGVPAPDDPAEYAVALNQWVGERVHAEIPGAADAVRSLAARGLRLHMASGGQSWELDPYLRAMGVREHFERLYGPDLVDRYKNGAHFYAAIVADSGTDPATSAVVEDSATAREWASSVGLRSFASLDLLIRALG
jgi:phosphoglycolate phosphatase-like HAD superfamily hydrolase